MVAGAREQLQGLVADLRHPQSQQLRSGYLYRVATRTGSGTPMFERKGWLAMAITAGEHKRRSNQALLQLVRQSGLDTGPAFQALQAYLDQVSNRPLAGAPDIQHLDQLLRAVLDEPPA